MDLIERDGTVCRLCTEDMREEIEAYKLWLWERAKGQKYTKRRQQINLNIDHIKPVASGGQTVLENLAVVHRTCNAQKGSLDLNAYKLLKDQLGKRPKDHTRSKGRMRMMLKHIFNPEI